MSKNKKQVQRNRIKKRKRHKKKRKGRHNRHYYIQKGQREELVQSSRLPSHIEKEIRKHIMGEE